MSLKVDVRLTRVGGEMKRGWKERKHVTKAKMKENLSHDNPKEGEMMDVVVGMPSSLV